jgi:ABC-type multidrug transport system ATPase subunit
MVKKLIHDTVLGGLERRTRKESIVAFMGLTGSGKSTFINLLLGENKAKVGHDIYSGK